MLPHGLTGPRLSPRAFPFQALRGSNACRVASGFHSYRSCSFHRWAIASLAGRDVLLDRQPVGFSVLCLLRGHFARCVALRTQPRPPHYPRLSWADLRVFIDCFCKRRLSLPAVPVAGYYGRAANDCSQHDGRAHVRRAQRRTACVSQLQLERRRAPRSVAGGAPAPGSHVSRRLPHFGIHGRRCRACELVRTRRYPRSSIAARFPCPDTESAHHHPVCASNFPRGRHRKHDRVVAGDVCAAIDGRRRVFGRGVHLVLLGRIPGLARIVIPVASARSPKSLLRFAIGAAFVAAIVLVDLPGTADHAVAMVVLGAALAPIFPLLLACFFATARSSSDSRWVLAICGFGGSVLPWLTGWVSARSGSLRLGLITVPAALFLILCLLPLIGSPRLTATSE